MKCIPFAWIMTMFLLLASSLQAGTLAMPDGLDTGDQYRLVFVTSSTTVATSEDIGYYNDFVTNAANNVSALENLGTTWTVIASTPVIDAKINTATDDSPAGPNGLPVYLLDASTRIAGNYDDLWDGTIDAALNRTELGGNYSGAVWTGTSSDGTATPNPLGGSGFGVGAGESTRVNSSLWIASFPLLETNEYPLYAISGVLTAGNNYST